MLRKQKRTQNKEKKEKENQNKKVKMAILRNFTKKTSNCRATNKLQSVTKNLFSKEGTELLINQPSTSYPSDESWYCALCDTEDQLDMRLCSTSLKYYHEICLGLSEDHTKEFKCPFRE